MGARPRDTLRADGVRHGWPRCLGARLAVEELGGTEEVCAATEVPLAVFPAGATPTGLAVASWDADLLLVSLWTRGEVVGVPIDGGRPQVFLDGLDGPQHLLALADGALLIGEHGTGLIHRIEPA